jgi:lipid-A-disaccharide synthase
VQRLLPEKTATIFISTGELSGEMHAAQLVEALQAERISRGLPPALIEGNGSAAMQAAGVILLHDVATWSELGIVANLLKAQHFHKVTTTTAKYILGNQPDMVVLVDNRFLNLSLARFLRSNGYRGRIVYYVAPVRWESLYKPGEHEKSLANKRFQDIKRFCDYAIPIYPVSLKVYEELKIPFGFFGHPLCTKAQPSISDEEFYALIGAEPHRNDAPFIIGAMPGSRVGEVKEIAPIIYRAMQLIDDSFREEPGFPRLHIVSPVAHEELREGMLAAARKAGLKNLTLIDAKYSWDLLARARVMVVKSGTGLHQCMLAGVPAVMCYRVPAVVAALLRLMRFSMPFYGLPNLLAGKAVVPELIQEDCTHTKIADTVGTLMFEEGERAAMLQSFAELRELVCRADPLGSIARAVQDLLPR